MTDRGTELLSPRSIGDLNRAAVLRALVVHGPSSRSELARLAGVTRATIGTIVHGLVDDGLLAEVDDTRAARVGKPARPLWLVAGAGTVAAVELAADTVRAALVDARGHVAARVSIALVDPADPAAIDAAIAGAIAALDRTQPLLGLGISVPGTCDVAAGEVLSSVHLPGAVGARLATAAAETTGLAVRIENNTRATALAEQWFGQGRRLVTFATIQTGDGLGAGIVLGGAVHRGPRGFGGEVGHTAVVFDGERCRCERTGCWETIATLGWLRRAAEAAGLPDARRLDAARLAALTATDRAADALLDRYADHLAVGIANLHGTLGIDRFILHGDAVGGGAPFAQRISAATSRRTGPDAGVEVTLSELADAALLGAAGVVLSDLLHTVNAS